jgi:hypothetical protein
MNNVTQGDVLAGRYRLIAPVGRGGTGMVYKAIDLTLERVVAIKIIPAAPADGAAQRPFLTEARTLAHLSHPNVLAVYDVGTANGCSYLVTEFIEGRSLAEILRQGAPLDPDYAIDIIAQVGHALGFMHENGLIHRDIKPANILVCESGRALLSDFGLAISFGDVPRSADGTVHGTPRYMSPEQAMGIPLDHRSDLYSLAVVLYETLSGQSWLSDESESPAQVLKWIVESPLPPIRQLNPKLSGAIDEVLEKALAKNPDARHLNADEFVHALRAVQSRRFARVAGGDETNSVLVTGTKRFVESSAAPEQVLPKAPPRRVLWPTKPVQLLAICAMLAMLAASYVVWGIPGVGAALGNWRGSVPLLIGGAICGLLVVSAWLQFQLGTRPSGSRSGTESDRVPVADVAVIGQERQTGAPHLDAPRRRESNIGADDLPATAAVAPYSPDAARRLDEFAAIWDLLSGAATIDKDRFVAAAVTIAQGLLREAVGYRIEQSIPYLKGTVGYMVDAPFLWIRHARFPVLFVAYDRRNADQLATVVQQLEIAKATEYFALLIVVAPRGSVTGGEAQELNQLVADSVYRHDFVVLDREHLARIIAEDSSRALVEIILEQRIELLAALSPYVVSGPVPESMFFGRERQLKMISQSISRSNFAVVGGRRIGKSSILLRLRRLFGDDPRYRAIYIDCEAQFDYRSFFASCREYANVPVDDDPSSFQRIAAALRAENASQVVVFLLDEIDELLEFDADRHPRGALFKAFRAASQEGVCRFVFTGSRTLYRHLRDAQSPFFNFCEPITLGRLEEKSIAEIVRKPMQQLGFDIPEGERLVTRLIDLTSAHPNIAQWMCDRLIKTSIGKSISVQALEQLATTPEFHEHYVSTAWGDARPHERLISLLMEAPAFTDSEVATKLAEHDLPRDDRAVRDSLEVLCLYSLLDRDDSGYRFALSQFPRIVRDSGVAPAQIEWLASEVRNRCS